MKTAPDTAEPLAPAAADGRARAILETSLDLFARRHVSSVSIKQIAAACGVQTSLLYYYFRNKDDLFQHAVDRAVTQVFDHFQAMHDAAGSPVAVLAGWLETHVERFDLVRKFVKVTVDYSASDARAPSVDAAIARFYDAEHAMLAGALAQGVANGTFRQVDVGRTATFISTVLDGIITRSLALPDFAPAAAVADLRDILSLKLGTAI